MIMTFEFSNEKFTEWTKLTKSLQNRCVMMYRVVEEQFKIAEIYSDYQVKVELRFAKLFTVI